MKSRGFTLIETLAAVALLGLIGSVAIIGLAGAGEQGRMTEAIAAVRDLDQRARLFAVNEGPVALVLDREIRRLSVRGAAGAVLAHRSLPESVAITLQNRRGRTIELIGFDRAGRCEDYAVEITASSAEVTLLVSGLTGWVEEAP